MATSCAYCSAPNAPSMCGYCQTAHYCNKQCQRADWHSGVHKAQCLGGSGETPAISLHYLATGFIMGTTHDVTLDLTSCTYKNHRAAATGATVVAVNTELCRRIRQMVENYVETEKFVPLASVKPRPFRGWDMGHTQFTCQVGRHEFVASPEAVPDLAPLLLQVDSTLARSPGGLWVHKSHTHH